MSQELLPEMDERSRECHELRLNELDPKRRAAVRVMEDQVNLIIREMERLSCMMAGQQCQRGAMQLDAGPRVEFERMAPWIIHRVTSKLHEGMK